MFHLTNCTEVEAPVVRHEYCRGFVGRVVAIGPAIYRDPASPVVLANTTPMVGLYLLEYGWHPRMPWEPSAADDTGLARRS